MRSFFKENFTSHLVEKLPTRHSGRKKQQLWSSRRYFAEKIDIHSVEQLPVKKQLQADLSSFFDEYAALKVNVTYQYGPNGIRNGYSESMSQIAANFLEQFANAGRPTARAELEVAVAATVEKWMTGSDLEVGAKLLAISPRGTQQEGYPGLEQEHYVFVNIFEKTEDGFIFQQFRNYEKNQDLPLLQTQLLQLGGNQLTALPNLQPTNTDKEFDRYRGRGDLEVIDNLIQLPASVPVEQITPLLLANKKNWPIDIDQDLPQLDSASYQAQLDRVMNFCLDEYTLLLKAEASQAVAQYDLLIDLTKQAFLKWVEDHALNYDHRSSKLENVNLEQLKNAWQTQLQQDSGQEISPKAKQQLRSFSELTSLNPNLPLNQAASWAHCITGTPLSMINNPSIMQAMQMNNLSINQLAEVIGKQRAELWGQGVCRNCGQHTLVGECSICLSCEIELGDQAEAGNLTAFQTELSDNFTGAEKHQANQLLGILAGVLLRSSLNLNQFLLNDLYNPEAQEEELADIAIRVKTSSAPLKELENIVFELTNGQDAATNSGKLFVFPNATKSAVRQVS